MKALPEDQRRLLDLQAVDLQIARYVALRAHMPEVARVKELTADHAAARDAAVMRRTALNDLEREVARAEDEVARVRARAQRDADLLSSGSITSAKQLQDLEHEIASLERRQAVLEEAELEVMEAVEIATAAQEAAELRRDELAAQLQGAGEERDRAVADLTAQYRAAQQRRSELAAAVPGELLALYEKVRADRDGVAAAIFADGRCGACQLQMVASEVAAVTGAAADEVVRCEECRRILVR